MQNEFKYLEKSQSINNAYFHSNLAKVFLSALKIVPFLLLHQSSEAANQLRVNSSSSSSSSSSEIVGFFKSAPEGGIKFQTQKNHLTIEYCPDNTCEKLIARKTIREDIFLDIALLYFQNASDYVYLKDWRNNMLVQHAQASVKTSIPACRDLEGYNLVACALLWAKRKHDMKIYFIRYDEQEKKVIQIFVQPKKIDIK